MGAAANAMPAPQRTFSEPFKPLDLADLQEPVANT